VQPFDICGGPDGCNTCLYVSNMGGPWRSFLPAFVLCALMEPLNQWMTYICPAGHLLPRMCRRRDCTSRWTKLYVLFQCALFVRSTRFLIIAARSAAHNKHCPHPCITTSFLCRLHDLLRVSHLLRLVFARSPRTGQARIRKQAGYR
jgi:hypothetical protein